MIDVAYIYHVSKFQHPMRSRSKTYGKKLSSKKPSPVPVIGPAETEVLYDCRIKVNETVEVFFTAVAFIFGSCVMHIWII